MLLREKDRQAIVRLARATFQPPVVILAYGSRVTGDAHETSDLDLALRRPDGEPIPLRQLMAFRNALRDSNIPILIDVMDWARMPETFRAQVQACHEVLALPDEVAS